MSGLHFRQKSLILARQLYPNIDGDDLIAEATRIFEYLSANSYQNFIGLNMVSEDILSFAELLSLDGVPLVLREYQRDTLVAWQTDADTAVVHGRQMGVTLLLCIYTLWLMSFKTKINLAYVVSNEHAIRPTIAKIKSLYDSSSFQLPEITKYNVNQMDFSNGNRLFVVRPSTYVMGTSMSHVLTEDSGNCSLAHEENLYSTIMFANRGQTIITGTPRKDFGFFYEIAETKKLFNNIERIDLPFHLNPEYTPLWEDQMRAQIGDTAFESQYNCVFERVKTF